MISDHEKLIDLPGSPFRIERLLDYQSGAVGSQTLVDEEGVTVTVFAFEEGERLSEHTAPHDAIRQVVEDTAVVTISGTEHEVDAGETIVLPADEPHAVDAPSRFKMVR
ncbi:MAG: cupin domain-containing protein [Halanaeroarchaeum sp.]